MEPGRLFFGLRHAYDLLRRDAETVAPEGMIFIEQLVLVTVGENPGIRTHGLARKIHSSLSNTKRALGRHYKAGLVKRKQVSFKETRLSLTPKGISTLASMRGKWNALADLYWGDLPESDLIGMENCLRKLQERSQ
ncbi:MAG: hypothetical protein FVQ81_13155 [Candidatus Glassbacteria bacterium]|nr:hypothetical protein [Candidatus Glassbacteria bacterium]